ACLSEETEGHKHLFPDYRDFISKPIDDIRALVRGRIAEHQQREQERLEAERERIRQEEAERLEREAEASRKAAEQAEAPAPAPSPARPAPTLAASTSAAAVPNTARIKLGEINDRSAAMCRPAAGLGRVGADAAEKRGAAMLCRGEDVPGKLQEKASVLAAMQEAA